MSPDLGETLSFAVIGGVLLASGLASSMVKRTFHAVMFLGVALVSAAALYILLGSALVGVIQVLVYVGGILTLFVFAVMFVAGDEKESEDVVPPPRSGAWPALAAALCGVAALVVAVLLGGRVQGGASRLLSGFLGDAFGRFAGFLALILLLVVLAALAIVAWLGLRHVIQRWPFARIAGAGVAALLAAMLLGVTAATHPWTQAGTDASVAAANDLDAVVAALFGPQVVAFEVLGVLLTAVMIGALVIARPLTGPSDAERYARVTRREVAAAQAVSDPGRRLSRPPAPPAAASPSVPPEAEA